MLVSAVSTKERFIAPETCKASEKKPCPEPSKPICTKTKPRRRVKRVNWCLPSLYSVAHFLRSASLEEFPYTILGKISEARAVRIIGTTLHVNVIRLQEKNELNLILLATSLHIVDKVRIHNFQINFYLTTHRQHICLTKAHWRAVGCVLPYVNQGPWVESEGKRERAVKITFDEFLRPTVEA